MKNHSFLLICLLLAVPQTLPAQSAGGYNFSIKLDHTLTLTGFQNVPSGDVALPANLTGLPVTSVGDYAFPDNFLTNVTIPASVTNIGMSPFDACYKLTAINVKSSNLFYASGGGVLFNKNQTTLLEYPEGKAGTAYVIPNNVTRVCDSAFDGCHSLTNITIPNGVGWIGERAFSSCALTSLAIPDSVTNLGSFAFAGQFSARLTNVTIPAGVVSVGDSPFDGCYSLGAINVNSSNANYTSINGILFTKNQDTLIEYPEGKSGSFYMLPGNVASVANSAFDGCQNLTGIVLPVTLTNIGNNAFSATALTNVAIPNSVLSVGSGAFANCPSLANVNLGSSIALIGAGAFQACPISGITIPDGVTNIGDAAFAACEHLASLLIGRSVTSIGSQAFADCPKLTSVTIPDSVRSIGAGAFNGGQSWLGGFSFLGSVKFGSNLVSIGDAAFQACPLVQVTIPNNVVSIGNNAFATCQSLSHLTLGAQVATIGAGAFSDCASLTSISIPASVTNVGAGAFSLCAKLSAITVDGQNLFYRSVNGVLFDKAGGVLIQYPAGRSGSYTIPASVERVEGSAFAGCAGLTSVSVPASVTNIGASAFAGCAKLGAVCFYGDAPGVDTTAFTGDSKATVYHLPGTSGWSNTFAGCPTTIWSLPQPQIITTANNFSTPGGQFGFLISWATNRPVVVEACTNLKSPVWSPVTTNALVNGAFYFTDSHWTNYEVRFYRLRAP